jgi:predicted RNase H-like nuclease (RuvC/YqgF family)
MGSKTKPQKRCPGYKGKVGRDLGTYDELCYGCSLLKLCESKAGRTLAQAWGEIEARREKEQEERFQEYQAERRELEKDIKTLFSVEADVKRGLISAFHALVDLCVDHGFDEDEDFEESFSRLKDEYKREEKVAREQRIKEARSEAFQTQYELDHWRSRV